MSVGTPYPIVAPQPVWRPWLGPAGGVTDALKPTYAAAPSGLSFWDGGGVVLHVKNAGGGAVTVTIPRNPVGPLGADVTFVVAAGSEAFIGPFPPVAFDPQQVANTSWHQSVAPPGAYGTYTSVTFSVTAGVTFALLDVGLAPVRLWSP